MVADIEAGIETKVDLKEAIHMLSNAWNAVSEDTVANCFKKAGFHDALNSAANVEHDHDSTEDIHEDASLDGSQERRNMWDFVAREYDVNITLDTFLTLDNDLEQPISPSERSLKQC